MGPCGVVRNGDTAFWGSLLRQGEEVSAAAESDGSSPAGTVTSAMVRSGAGLGVGG